MRLYKIEEPHLEFGYGTHVDPKTGITQYSVYDAKFNARRDRILVGAVGTSDNLSALTSWIERCSRPIPAPPDSRQRNLRVPFCGFNRDGGFRAALATHAEIARALTNSDVRQVLEIRNWNERVAAAVELYYRQIRFLTQNRVLDVVVCVIPSELHAQVAKVELLPVEETATDSDGRAELESNFRRALRAGLKSIIVSQGAGVTGTRPMLDQSIEGSVYLHSSDRFRAWDPSGTGRECLFRPALKAKAMHLGKPLQLLLESTMQPSGRSRQDDATKAWNFCTALYYKANQTVPWRLIPNRNRPAVCYVGIGFYRSRDRAVLNTSLAQVFDELGNGVVLRGTPVTVDRKDRQPHLTQEQAYGLLTRALSEYELALHTAPARIVIHKSSNYDRAELDGFKQAIRDSRVRSADFITILDSSIRLFRDGMYPPYRGTHVELDRNTHLLYTRGSVEFYRTYPGLYVPQPLEIRIVESDESPGVIGEEILSLSKMNWNNTQFDGKYPITIQCARSVGNIMKYLGPNDPEPQISYSYYM
jgi:hypothetical protein